MIARILVALGFTIASVGLTVFGMGTSMSVPDQDLENLGLYLMIGGTVAGVIGIFWYRADEKKHGA
ncbi:MAG: hypothetical protein IT334_05525 [Thermomicrobiales bacterium]|nr:hypothetical protein [Thermomicrobiales bacterium]